MRAKWNEGAAWVDKVTEPGLGQTLIEHISDCRLFVPLYTKLGKQPPPSAIRSRELQI